ncbi:hypothetical protein FI667_g299, partial [Globisporangium splendens]
MDQLHAFIYLDSSPTRDPMALFHTEWLVISDGVALVNPVESGEGAALHAVAMTKTQAIAAPLDLHAQVEALFTRLLETIEAPGGMTAATIFVLEQGFSGKQFERLEMTKHLGDMPSHDDDLELPDGIEVTTLDLTDVGRLRQVYSVLSMVFGSRPPSFEAWKQHYAQQPHFAPELSFRIVDGEGGGDDEASLIFATYIKVMSEKKDADEPVPEVSVLVFPADFEERKQKITQNATTAYVCEVATLLVYCSKGLAGNLLQRSFLAAKEISLEKVTLGTDDINAKAMRAYAKAGMVETKSAPSPGGTVTTEVLFRHP